MPFKLSLRKIIISIILVAVFVVIFGLIFGFKTFVNFKIDQFVANYKAPPQVVSVAKAESATWTPYIEATGYTQAINGVQVTPQTSGQVVAIHFKSGQLVTKGQVLVSLDPRVAKAQLDNAVAAVKLAEIDYKRQSRLYKQNAVSQSTLDGAIATLQEDRAQVAQFKTQLAYKTIRAPFSGRIGVRVINIGQYLQPGDNIASLQSLSPIYLNFTIPEQQISQLYLGQTVQLTVGTFPGVKFSGKITALDSNVSSDTRGLMVQATLPNNDPKHLLFPGMFSIVHVLLPQQNHVVVVPQQAINYTLYGDSVFTVQTRKDKKGKTETYAKLTYVKTGTVRGKMVQVTSGLKVGEKIVTEGLVKLQDGTPIVISKQKDDNNQPISNQS